MQARADSLPAGNRGSGRLPSLDGLRAVAILMVLGSHLPFTRGFPSGNHRGLFTFFDGELGVRIFFVISGFIITRLLLDEERSYGQISMRLFYVRRALRILPVYLAYLGVLVVLSLLGRYHDSPSSWLGCLTFTRNLFGRGDSATEHFWSLAIEEQFYLFWPSLFFLLQLGRRRSLALTLLTGLTLAALGVRIFFPPTAFDGNLLSRILSPRSLLRYADSLALGCAAAFLQERFMQRSWARAGLLAALLLALEQFADKGFFLAPTSALHALIPALQAATVAILLLCLLVPSRSPLYVMLNQKLVMRIGLLSYSLYVWHFLFLFAFAPDAWPFPILYQWTFWWLPAAIVAFLSFEYFELPLLRLRRSFRRTAASSP